MSLLYDKIKSVSSLLAWSQIQALETKIHDKDYKPWFWNQAKSESLLVNQLLKI